MIAQKKIVKVCGMRDPENIRLVEAAGIDLMGFIFHPGSPRYAGENPPEYLPSCRRIGVFVNKDTDAIIDIACRWRLWAVQLHGNERPEQCKMLQEAGLKVLKAFGIKGALPANLSDYYDCCDMFVFDTATARHGGSGRKFDWAILDDYAGKVPFLLSGGINPDSIDSIKAFAHPCCIGIDINSGFEVVPGLKDADKIANFINSLK